MVKGQHTDLYRTASPPVSINDAIAAYNSSLQRALTDMERRDDLMPIATSIRDGTTAAVTDRSFELQQGRSAFTLVDLTSGVQLTGANHTPGLKTDHCSYRSELTGIFGTVILFDCICQFSPITDGQVIIGCDNLEAGQYGISFKIPSKSVI
jgi:hypothetical protein